jgi:ankyrin repeat protein
LAGHSETEPASHGSEHGSRAFTPLLYSPLVHHHSLAMPLSGLPLELLLMIAHHITDDQGERGFADFNAFLQVNRAFYSSLNPILWRSATEHSAITTRVLTHLICGNHLPRLQYFLELGADVETVLPDFNTPDRELLDPSPLVVAAYHLDSVPLARLLLEKGAKVQYDEPRYSALHAARSAKMVQLLLAHHADPEWPDFHGCRPLHWYAWRNDIAAMRVVLSCGVDVNLLGQGRRTPLHNARGADAVKLLLEFGVDVKKPDLSGDTPLHIQVGNPDVMGLLVESWPEGTRERNNDGNTPLHEAVERRGEMKVVKLLVECWPEAMREKNQHGDTPLHLAAAMGEVEMVRLLLERWPEGAREKDNDGNTPLHAAVVPPQLLLSHLLPEPEVVRLLVECWPEGRRVLNKEGWNPLSALAWRFSDNKLRHGALWRLRKLLLS